ncbi:cysteine desulfurase family protein [Alkalimarinus alittae]|uniref:cysteine desulfurase n=1 Tax=Alkalimarinus alittae TaxID=2961619 RepID=A0ABY6N3X0_9ALTE|nr:cysteine desulfurase family protein [Alkalimarinus alittae]UZE96815.1 cysteine desulfurase [Alkalimarinus alittae]
MIYFDSAASYPILPEVLSSIEEGFKSYANPSSSHIMGLALSQKVEDVRLQIADSIGALPSEVVFTSGATESNNLAIKGAVFGSGKPFSEIHLVTSQAEHKCVLNIFSYLEGLGCQVSYIKPNAEGVITLQLLEEVVTENTILVSLMHVNNELGVINPIQDIGEFCFDKKIKLHTDAAQSFGKIDIDVMDSYVDFMSLTAHKIGGPKGIGALYIQALRTSNIVPVIHGAGQEEGLRGGTLPAPLILGFGAALSSFQNSYSKINAELEATLLKGLQAKGVRCQINGANAERVKHIVSVTLPDTNPVVFMRNTERDFCLAQGSACSSKEIEPSHVLSSIGLGRDLASKTYRLSFSHETTVDDIKAFVQRVAELIE